jgi:hypothetical protein
MGMPISHNNIPRMVRVSASYGGEMAEQRADRTRVPIR